MHVLNNLALFPDSQATYGFWELDPRAVILIVDHQCQHSLEYPWLCKFLGIVSVLKNQKFWAFKINPRGNSDASWNFGTTALKHDLLRTFREVEVKGSSISVLLKPLVFPTESSETPLFSHHKDHIFCVRNQNSPRLETSILWATIL